MKRKGPIGAAELMAQLEQDPEYQARRAALDRERALKQARFKELEEPVLQDLRQIGVFIATLSDLTAQYGPLREEIICTLLKWIRLTSQATLQDAWFQQWLVRPLAAVKEPFDASPLTVLFEKTNDESLRWQIANAIAQTRPRDVTDWVVRAVENQAYDQSREMLVLALARLAPKEVAQPILMRLLEHFPGFVAMAWSEIGTDLELQILETKVETAKPAWVKKEFVRAIKNIKKRANVNTGGVVH